MRRLPALLAALVGATVLVTAPPARAASSRWAGRPTLVAGTSRYDAGEWIANDFVFDDYGADTGSWGQPNVVGLAPTAGDARYPSGPRYAGNAADIVEVRARRRGPDVEVRVRLQTLVDPTVPALWVRANGRDRIVDAHNAAVDAAANTLSFRLPGAARAATLALNIGAGLSDGKGGLVAGRAGNAQLYPNEVTTGGDTANRLFDLAFNTREIEGRGGAWNEDVQSKALAAGDLDRFTQRIDIAKLTKRVHTELPWRPGYYVRLFESRQPLTEGMKPSFPQYGGSLQPYALWIPKSYDPARPAPLFLNLHSLSVHHNQYRGGSSGTYTTFYEQMGDRLGAVVVTPLGRGPDGWYRNEAFVDTLEVWTDARRTFRIDDTRTLLSGYSMGGYGTYRLATLMPDRFASAVSVVGPPTDGIWTGLDSPTTPYFTYPQLENTLHVPFWITHGAADELVPVLGVTRQAQRLGDLGHEYRFALHPVADHLSFSVQDNWSREAAWFAAHPVRVADPAELTLRIRPASVLSPDKRAALGALTRSLLGEIGADVAGGYWVHDVVVAGAGTADVTGVVDLRSGGITRRRGAVAPVRGPGVDGPSPYVLTGSDVAVVDAPRADTLTGTLARVTALTVDVGRAGLSDTPTLDLRVDRPVTLTFVRGTRVVGRTTVAPPPA